MRDAVRDPVVLGDRDAVDAMVGKLDVTKAKYGGDFALVGFFDAGTDEAVAFAQTRVHVWDIGGKQGVDMYRAPPAMAAGYGLTAPAVLLFTAHDGGADGVRRVAYDGDVADGEAILDFAKRFAGPALFPFTGLVAARNFASFWGAGADTVYILSDLASDAYKAFAKEVPAIAAHYRQKGAGPYRYKFVAVDKDDTGIWNLHGLKYEEGVTKLVVAGTDKVEMKFRRYTYHGALTVEGVMAFLQRHQEGAVNAEDLSAPVNEGWETAPVAELVGSHLCEVALSPDRDVLLKMYSPQCKKCAEFDPIWKELGEAFAGIPDVMVAQLDMSRNQPEGCEELVQTSLPGMRFAPAGGDTFLKVRRRVRYTGQFIQFVYDNCKSEGCKEAIEAAGILTGFKGSKGSKDEL